jgi:hypothetical protein
MSKSRSITMRIDADLDERLKAAAEKDQRPVAQLLRKIVVEALVPRAAGEGDATADRTAA